MRLSRVYVSNYRSLKDFEVQIDDYTALVGANGTGKSSLLYALEWFYEGPPLEALDIHGVQLASSSEAGQNPRPMQNDSGADEVRVSVTFGDLTPADRRRLGPYGRGSTASFSRTWKMGDQKSKVIGNAKAGPGFPSIRQMSRVGDFRPAYVTLQQTICGLPDLGPAPTKDAVHQALAEWEDRPESIDLLEDVHGSDANHLFGVNGTHVIRECIEFILVPAAAPLASEIGNTTKGSALSQLIGSYLTSAGRRAREEWITTNRVILTELNKAVRESITDSTALQSRRINSRLHELVPGAKVGFDPTIPDWTPKGDATVATSFELGGFVNDIARQGHGVQRAVMIAMLQALVPDEDLARSTHSLEDDESETEAAERLSQALEHLPSMIIGIEELEIYQHPVRARAFARVLSSLTKDAGVQLIAATHSPYFVRPEQFESVRRVVAGDGGSRAIQTTLTEISDRANCEQESARKTIEQLVPKTFSEGFFADGVVLVEGDTDRVIVEVLAERLGSPLDLIGISVLDTGGKANLHLPYCLLSEFEVPCYVLVDGDGEGAARKYGTNESALLKYKDGTEDYTINRKKYESALISHRSQTEAICQWLPPSTEPTRGTLPASFNQGTLVTEMFCLWNTDIESELEHWPSFVDALKQAGSTLRKKDLMAYRTAAVEAKLDDMPTNVQACIDAICADTWRNTNSID